MYGSVLGGAAAGNAATRAMAMCASHMPFYYATEGRGVPGTIRVVVMWPVTLPGSWVASTKRWKDAGSADSPTIGATEDAPARSVIAGQGPGERCRLHH